MDDQLRYSVKKANVNVVGEPGGGEPASAVLSKEYAHSANEREKAQEKNPNYVVFFRVG